MNDGIARAYVYTGLWVADCPRGCNNTERLFEDLPNHLQKRKIGFNCSYCHYSTPHVEWPSNTREIESVLKLRPIPHNRNWYPKDHDIAVRFRIPHGQTIDELKQENIDHGVPAE